MASRAPFMLLVVQAWVLACEPKAGSQAADGSTDAAIVEVDAARPVASARASGEGEREFVPPADPTTAAGVFLLGGHGELDAGTQRGAHRPLPITSAELGSKLRETPEFSVFGGNWKVPDQRDLEIKILRLKKLEKGSHLTIDPILWTPAEGQEFLVTTARTPRVTVIAVFRARSSDQKPLAAQMVFASESAPIAFDYDPVVPTDVRWTMCRNCRGEEGTIRFRRTDNTITIRQD